MEPIKVTGQIVEKTSSKTGNKYVCLEVYLTDTYKTNFFLKDAEVEILKLYIDKQKNNSLAQ